MESARVAGPARHPRGEQWLVPASAIFAGALVRLTFLLRSDFALNDGGLFYLMTQELQRARYALPAFTAYNGAGIPFAYPPLGLYLAGLVDDLGPWSLIDVFRFMPLAVSLLTIPAFYALARALLPERRTASLAVFAFALLPGSFAWQIMGGGVTRAPGMLCATLAVWQAHALYTRGGWRYVLTTGLLAGLTALSHLAMASLAAVSIFVLYLARGRSRAALGRSLLVAAAAAAVSAPWWGAVLARHGLAPFLAAGRSPEPATVALVSLTTLALTDEPFFPLLGALALLGVLVCLARRRPFLPAWAAAIFLLDPRTARTTASLPLALLAAVGAVDGLWPLLAGEAGRRCLARGALGLALAFALVSALAGPSPLLQRLAPDERAAMAWVAEHTPPSATFLVVTGDRTWGGDRSSEWFPVLAQRPSLATVQGREWFDGFDDRGYAYALLQRCAGQGGECLEAWARERDADYSYVYVARRAPVGRFGLTAADDPALTSALRCDPGYRLVYNGPGAAVYARVQTGAELP